MPSVFIGKLSNGLFRVAVAKPGYDAKDPATKLANMKWSSEVATVRQVTSGEITIPGFSGVVGTDLSLGPWTNVTIPAVVGTPFILCMVQAVTRWSYTFHSDFSGYSVVNIPNMNVGWYAHPRGPFTNSSGAGWRGARLDAELLNATTVRFRCNNSGNGTNNTTRVRYRVFESR